MKHKLAVIQVRIKIDPVPGWGHDPQDYVKAIQDDLNYMVPHYNPEVRLIDVVEVASV